MKFNKNKKRLLNLTLASVMIACPTTLAGCSINDKDNINNIPIWKQGKNLTEFTDAKIGDYFIDTDDYVIYQKNETGNWDIIMSDFGKPGHSPNITINSSGYWVIDNVSTDKIAIGTNGSTPYIHESGYWYIDEETTGILAKGQQGNAGKSAFELYKETNPNYTGTVEDWLNSLKGKDGVNGSMWFTGNGIPSSDLGNISDFYIDKENNKIYEKTNSGWNLAIHFEKELEQYYYDDIEKAITAINTSSYDEIDMVIEDQANVAIFIENNIPNLVILHDININTSIKIQKDMILNLNGKTLSFKNTSAFDILSNKFTVDGEVEGSKIIINNDTQLYSTIFTIESSDVIINGGTYETNSSGIGDTDNPNASIILNSSSSLNIENASIISNDKTTGTVSGILINRGSTANIVNCNIVSAAPNGLNVSGVKNIGVSTIINSTIIAKSNHTANADVSDYATTSRGVINNGILTLKKCRVDGTHSGISTTGVLYIDGGVYEGYSHGGIYFYGAKTYSYIKNANIGESLMPEGFIDDGKAGTNHAGMYIGGADNITVYMDNCHLYGVYYPLVMKKKCSNNIIYISNSTINEDAERYIRLDSDANKLYIGLGNDFGTNETNLQSAVIETNEDYLFYFPNY